MYYSKMALKSDYDFQLKALEGLAHLQEATEENDRQMLRMQTEMSCPVPLNFRKIYWEGVWPEDPSAGIHCATHWCVSLATCFTSLSRVPAMRSEDNEICLNGWLSTLEGCSHRDDMVQLSSR